MAGANRGLSGGRLRMADIPAEPRKTLAPIDGYASVPLVSIDAAVVPLTTLVPNVKKYVQQAKSVYRQEAPPQGLTIDEAASIRLYTMETADGNDETSFYKVLNDTLRSKDRQRLPPWYLYLKLLLTALSRFQSTQQFLFRAVSLDLHLQYPANTTVTWWGFSSTTMKVEVLKPFLENQPLRTMFTIDSRSGKNIRSFSRYPEEEEVLILPETQFEVVSCLDNGHGLHTIQLREIRSPHTLLPAPVPPKLAADCNGQACRTCDKCCDWRLYGSVWKRSASATCKHRYDPSIHKYNTCECN